MLPGADFAAVAISLAALEYYLGAGFFALGGFSRSFRGNGRDMMENATISMILVSSIGLLVAVINFSALAIYQTGDLTGPYETFYKWVDTGVFNAQASIATIAGLQWGLAMMSKIITGYLPAFVWGEIPGMAPAEPASLTFGTLTSPWVQMLQAGYMILTVSAMFGMIIQKTWFVFVAYGSLAYALPKRLGRGIGGSLISGALVYYVGLPLMPQFVEYFLGPTWDKLVVTCTAVQTQMPGYACPANPMYPWSITNWGVLWNIAWGLAPGVNFQVWAILMLPTLYLALLAGISGGVAKVLQAAQLSLFPGGLM